MSDPETGSNVANTVRDLLAKTLNRDPDGPLPPALSDELERWVDVEVRENGGDRDEARRRVVVRLASEAEARSA